MAFNRTQKLEWFGIVCGRIGIAVTPRVLFQGTGGLALWHVCTEGSVKRSMSAAAPGSNIFMSIQEKYRLCHDSCHRIALSGAPLIVGYCSHIIDNTLRFGVNYCFSGT